MRKILPSITSIGLSNSSWRDKIAELQHLEIREVALFLTGLSVEERVECMARLERVRKEFNFTIPFCHAVSTMCEAEFCHLADTFGTQRFNLHPVSEFPLSYLLSDKIRENIFIENAGKKSLLLPEDLSGFAGVCLDLSHLWDLTILNPEYLSNMYRLLDSTDIGANHMSAASLQAVRGNDGALQCSNHFASKADDFDYLSHIPSHYFSDFCAIEVENPLKEQIAFKDRIHSLIERPAARLKQAA